jgi:hypothetical protein
LISAVGEELNQLLKEGCHVFHDTGEPVKAKPILTFPGWFVKLTGKSDVHVLNPKQIRDVILCAPPQLFPEQIKRIVHQVEQKCRDVAL